MIAFLTLGGLGVLGANPFRGGEENRAKDAKDAKVKGTPIRGLVSYSFTRRRGGAEARRGRRGRRHQGQVLWRAGRKGEGAFLPPAWEGRGQECPRSGKIRQLTCPFILVGGWSRERAGLPF